MVTVFVPALNEEENLRQAIQNVIRYAKAAGDVAIEIIIVNDGSTDGTSRIIAELEKEHPFIRSIHHPQNQGLGASLMKAVHAAKFDKIALYPGDDAVSAFTMRNLFRHAHLADFIGAYVVNTESRSGFRNALSNLFSLIYTSTFGLHLKYIHETPAYSVPMLRQIRLNSRRYSVFSEINVKMLRKGASFMEVEGYLKPGNRKSSAVKLRNLLEVVSCYLRLIAEVYVFKRGTYSHRPKRIIPAEVEL